MAALAVVDLVKRFGAGAPVLDHVSLEVPDGELLAILGPSGCGKSTLLQVIAGLEAPDSGRVLLDDREVTALAPAERDVAMVFQSYALYPHKTVRENLAFPLRMRRMPAAERDARVRRVADSLGLTRHLDRKPGALSGGERQRVALGRAIVREPRAFLLDEPLSNLDARLRVSTRAEIARLQSALGVTMLYVTHDQEEAMTLGGRIAVMREGRVLQVGPPLDVYRCPANAFVAEFVGHPPMNLISGVLRWTSAGPCFTSDALTIPLPQHLRARAEPAGEFGVLLGIRPEDVTLANDASGGDAIRLVARLERIEELGRERVASVCLGRDPIAPELRVVLHGERALAVGAPVGITLSAGRIHLFRRSDGARLDPS